MTTGRPIRILLAEDHPLVGEELCALLGSYPNIEVVGRAQDGDEAVKAVARLQPAVVVMDINLPKLDGIAATREIKRMAPRIVVIGLTAAVEDYVLYAMRKAGADEVLTKDKVANGLYNAIQRAVASAHPIVILPQNLVPSGPSTAAAESEYPSKTEQAEENTPGIGPS